MLERQIEEFFTGQLKKHGFAVYKLVTPGKAGVPDRMILYPKFAPQPPVFVELKAPGKAPRMLQDTVARDWRARGAQVAPYIDSMEAAVRLLSILCKEAYGVPLP